MWRLAGRPGCCPGNPVRQSTKGIDGMEPTEEIRALFDRHERITARMYHTGGISPRMKRAVAAVMEMAGVQADEVLEIIHRPGDRWIRIVCLDRGRDGKARMLHGEVWKKTISVPWG